LLRYSTVNYVHRYTALPGRLIPALHLRARDYYLVAARTPVCWLTRFLVTTAIGRYWLLLRSAVPITVRLYCFTTVRTRLFHALFVVVTLFTCPLRHLVYTHTFCVTITVYALLLAHYHVRYRLFTCVCYVYHCLFHPLTATFALPAHYRLYVGCAHVTDFAVTATTAAPPACVLLPPAFISCRYAHVPCLRLLVTRLDVTCRRY